MTARVLTPAVAAALADGHVRPAIFFEGEFATGFVRLWTGVGEVQWGGQTWSGLGSLLGIGVIGETDRIEAAGSSVTLSGVPTDLVSVAITEAKQGLPGKIWLGFLDQDWQVIDDPVLSFVGRLDVPTIDDGRDSCTVTITYESRLIDLLRPREWRYTHESQQVLHPGDRGFEYVSSIQDKEVRWG